MAVTRRSHLLRSGFLACASYRCALMGVQPASMLRSLYVSYNASDRRTSFEITLPTIFNNQTPALRHLVMDHVASWSDNTFGHLTHLHLSGIEFPELYDRGPALVNPYGTFLHLLRCNPSLEVLSFEELLLVARGIPGGSPIRAGGRNSRRTSP